VVDVGAFLGEVALGMVVAGARTVVAVTTEVEVGAITVVSLGARAVVGVLAARTCA
jgi:hypothetical protein